MAVSSPPHDVRVSLWRAVAGFRVAALAYLIVVFARLHQRYAHLGVGIAVLIVVAAVTAGLVLLVARGLAVRAVRAQAAVVGADVILTAVLTLATVLVQAPADYGPGSIPTVTTVWAAGPLLEAAIIGGVRWGIAAAVIQFVASVFAHGIGNNDSIGDGTLANGAVLVLAAAATGYAARIAVRGQQQLVAAAAAEAEVAARERLARSIHDGALQALALLQRRLREPVADDERAQLAALAGAQEIAMRTLLTRPAISPGSRTRDGRPSDHLPPERHDVMAALRMLSSTTITVSGPALPILLPSTTVDELQAATSAALDNVERHAGPRARAWVVVEATPTEVVVTVRDDGVGTTVERLESAAADGRMGFAGSVRGRIRDLGGRVEVFTAPDEGVELSMRIPTAPGVAP